MSLKSGWVVLAFVIACPAIVRAQGQVYYVDIAAPPQGDGLAWQSAFRDLQDALAIAQGGDEIRVARGVYRPDRGNGDRTARFQLQPGIRLLGGYAGVSQTDPGARDPVAFQTTLSGDIGVPGTNTDNTYRIVVADNCDPNTLLDGFTITEGNADGPSPNSQGAGLSCSGGSLVVNDCRFTNNVGNSGGALSAASVGLLSITNCRFISNTSGGNGGAILLFGTGSSLADCYFQNNYAPLSGGAVANLSGTQSLIRCTFYDNQGLLFGGGVYNNNGSGPVVDCVFRSNVTINGNNLANDGGGGYYNDFGSPTLTRCLFSDNITSADGGGVYTINGSPTFVNCSFVSNLAVGLGGGLYAAGTGRTTRLRSSRIWGNTAFNRGGGAYSANHTLDVQACTIVRNTSHSQGGGVFLSNSTGLLNSTIFWASTASGGQTEPAQMAFQGPVPSVNFCCVEAWTGGLGGIGNVSLPPMFVDPDGPDNVFGNEDDSHLLSPNSPCLDRGDSALIFGQTDQDAGGMPRLMGCSVDIGAHEFRVGMPHSGDLNGDGVIDGRDMQPFSGILALPGQLPFECVADLNNDGKADAFDAQLFQATLLGPVTPPPPKRTSPALAVQSGE